jgi:LPS O-antigen subunit length determinant protein (WzzB/FepE family)
MSEQQNVALYEDEIELIDILNVVWKWKSFIILGTLLITMGAAIVSYKLPKIYKIKMMIHPGIISINPDGTRIYTDSSERIEGKIKSGIYDAAIIAEVNRRNTDQEIEKIAFDFENFENFDGLSVSYETSETDKGLLILNLLKNNLVQDDKKQFDFFINDFDKKIFRKKIELENNNVILDSYKKNLSNFNTRIIELENDIKEIANNTRYLLAERNNLLKSKSNNETQLSFLVYTNTIQQNLQIENGIKHELNTQVNNRENQIKANGEQLNIIKKLTKEIEELEENKKNVEPLQILDQPGVEKYPVKPKKVLIVFLSVIIGAFFSLFTAFFLEYIKNNIHGVKSGSN